MRDATHRGWCIVLAGALALGCSRTVDRPDANGEDEVRKTFAAFQAALRARDGDKIWALLDSEAQADAERATKSVKEGYVKAEAEDRKKQESALGLTGAELAKLTAPLFLKSSRFHGKYDEVPDAKLDRVVIEPSKQKATAHYTESDGDKEKLLLVRQDGEWKISVPMPK